MDTVQLGLLSFMRNPLCRYNLIFILSAGGKFNYQGARQWIDEHVEQIGKSSVFYFFLNRVKKLFCFRKRSQRKAGIRHVFRFVGQTRTNAQYARF